MDEHFDEENNTPAVKDYSFINKHNNKPPKKPTAKELANWKKKRCYYCKQKTVRLVDSITVYRKDYGMLWECAVCKARVGCHKNSKTFAAMGTVADEVLRALRFRVHVLLRGLVQRKMDISGLNRGKATHTMLAWFAEEMELEQGKCHVGWFREDDCTNALAIISMLATSGKAKIAMAEYTAVSDYIRE